MRMFSYKLISKYVKCGAIASVAMLASCASEDLNIENPDNEVVPAKAADVNVISDPAELAQYVTNYKTPSSRVMKAPTAPALEDWDMPALPTSFDGMTKVVCPSWKWGGLDGNTKFYVAPGETQDYTNGGLNANNQCDLYVYGTLILPSFAPAQGINIYVAKGGKLEITGKQWDGSPNGVLTDDKNTNLYIYNGGQYVGSLTSKSKCALYVEGDITTGNVSFGGKVRVKGTLKADALYTDNANIQAAAIEAKSWTFYNNSKVNVEYDINIAEDVTINAQNVIDCSELSVDGYLHMENLSKLYAYEHIFVGKHFEHSTQGEVYTPCLYVTEKFFVKNAGKVIVPKQIYCAEFEAPASGFNIEMGGDALFYAAGDFTIQNKGWNITFTNDATSPSAIVANRFQIMEGQAAYISGYAYLSASEYWGKPSENHKYYQGGDSYDSYTLQETVKASINGVQVNGNLESCTPSFKVPGAPETPDTPDDDPVPPTITELISSINHTHDISATCVAIGNGKAYLSWHKRGTSIHGCLEALQVVADQAALTSWMEVNDDDVEGGDNWGGNSAAGQTDETQGQYDFNHLIVANNQVVTVGDNAKMSGFIGTIALNGSGDFGTNGTLQDAFQARQLLGAVSDKVGRSGNTVVYAGGKYYIACAAGFQEYNGNINDLFLKNAEGKWVNKLGAYELTAGSAKHIAVNGSKVATLEFDSRSGQEGDDYWFNDTETAFNGILKVRSTSNWLNNSDWSVNIGAISPIYGKNAIAMDESGNVYVSAGKQGLLVYNNGTKVGEFKLGEKKYRHAGVNGVAIDNRYVYVAYGTAGLWILNKSDLSVVSWYKSNAPIGYETEAAAASANYVALDGTYIYVAYGRHGVKVLKLND